MKYEVFQEQFEMYADDRFQDNYKVIDGEIEKLLGGNDRRLCCLKDIEVQKL